MAAKLKIEKRGRKFKKKSSPLKLLSPIAIKLLWNDPKLCPVIPTSNQDGAKLKIEKRGDEIIPLEMHFFVDSLLLVTQIIKGKQLYCKM